MPNAIEVIECPLGVRTSKKVTVPLLSGNAPGDPDGYTWADTPYSLVWSGDDQPAIANAAPACSWLDPVNCIILLDVSAANTAALATPGTYRCDIRIRPDDGGDDILAATLALKLTAAPGAAAPPLAYCTFADILDYAPYVGQIADLNSDLAGMGNYRSRARKWWDRIIVQRYRGWLVRRSQLGHASDGGGWGWEWSGTIPTPVTLQAALDAGGLLITDRVVEANARYAAGLLGAAQLTPGDDAHDAYSAKAKASMERAKELAFGYTAEISLATPPDTSVIDMAIGEESVGRPSPSGSGWWPDGGGWDGY